MTETPERAAGGLLWRHADDGDTEILIAHRPRYDDWAYPKGKLDAGETLIECALREVHEETGYTCTAGAYLGETEFTMPSGITKVVAYWAMEVVDGSFEPNDEIDEIAWVPVAELPVRLSYEVDAELVAQLPDTWTDPPSRIILTRHAHAGDRFRWSGDDDSKRPLSAKGEAEANGIVAQLSGFAIDRILSSHATRCIDTVAPLASARGIEIEIEDALWEETPYADVRALIEKTRHVPTVLSTHGPIVAAAIHAITGASIGVPMEKGSTWILDFTEGRLAAANYLPPPSE